MPVSSPSYFPPQRGTDQIVGINAGIGQTGARCFLAGANAGNYTAISDLIVIGDAALSSATALAKVTDTKLAGTIVLGSNAAKALSASTPSVPASNSSSFIGGLNCLKAAPNIDSSVVIGDGNFSSYTDNSFTSTVCLGARIFPNYNPSGVTFSNNVFLGYGVGFASTLAQGMTQNVIIGALACNQPAQSLVANVVIGYACVTNLSSGSGLGGHNVILGTNIQSTTGIINNSVIIGDNASSGDTAAHHGDNLVALGAQVQVSGGNHVCIGGSSRTPNNAASAGCVIIGANAGTSLGGTVTDVLCVETQYSSSQKALIYGSFANGNVIFGNSLDSGSTRALINTPQSSSNIIGILIGTKATVNPVGGGYFYYETTSGTPGLHFVSSGGTDTVIAPL